MANRVAIAPTMSSSRRPNGNHVRRRFLIHLPRVTEFGSATRVPSRRHESRDRAATLRGAGGPATWVRGVRSRMAVATCTVPAGRGRIPPPCASRKMTLPGGERVATEPLRGVRSAALGLWIATGSRDEPRARAGSRTSSSTCCSRARSGTARRRSPSSSTRWAASSTPRRRARRRSSTRACPTPSGERALDAMTDMVFAPSFDDVDNEREVVSRRSRWSTTTPGPRPRPRGRGRFRGTRSAGR